MFSASRDYSELANLKHKRHRDSSRSIHPYFGKVDPALSIEGIRSLSARGQVVLDPFCGSGTVIHDAVAAGRNAVGWDSSPLATLITTAKILGVTKSEEAELVEFLNAHIPNPASLLQRNDVDTEYASLHVPRMPRVHSVKTWFTANALAELAVIRGALQDSASALSAEAELLLKVAFSKIIVAASLQQGESTYRRVVKDDTLGRVLGLYEKAVKETIAAARAFNAELSELGARPKDGRLRKTALGYVVQHGEITGVVEALDSRAIQKQESYRFDLVVTSPPYLMSWDYGLYHKFRFYWLGFDLDGYEETEIGRHLRRKDDDVQRYSADMRSVFTCLAGLARKSARIVMVNAPSVVYGKEVDTNKLLADLAAMEGWKCAWSGNSLGIPGPHHGMYESLGARGATAPGSAGKREHVLIFER